MIEWLWPWAFAALPLPLLIRLLLPPSQRTESALTVPDMNTLPLQRSLIATIGNNN